MLQAPPETIAARDEGIEQVLEHNIPWHEAISAFFDAWAKTKPPGYEFIAETFRLEALAAGIEPPKHHNAWGAFFSRLSQAKRIRFAGKIQSMVTVTSHARKTLVYTLCD